jgi:Fungal specific transcription factor domain/Fungal Zn(2)-Cys(6) binuclear cluster domain
MPQTSPNQFKMAPIEDAAAKRPRTSRPKVRTGCKTCKVRMPFWFCPYHRADTPSVKIRHVKCDETKPTCMRCFKFGAQCDGYLEKSASKAPLRPRRLSPKGYALIPSVHSQIYQAPSHSLFGNEQEQRYFHVFCSQTAPQLGGFFEKNLWQTLVLQACETESPLRHAIIALGALNIASSPRRHKGPVSSNRQFAFREYSKAVSQVRQKVASWKVGERGSERDLRTTLISCLLFTCFETFNGCSDAAIAQIYAGVRIIEEWQRQHIQDADHLTPVSSPRPLAIEDDLLHAFDRLEMEAMTYRDFRASKIRKANGHWGRSDLDHMPREFTSLAEARVYLSVVIRRGMHFGAWIEDKIEANGAWALYLHNSDFVKEYSETENETNRILAEYEKWSRAFEPLWLLSRSEAGKSLFEGATTLRLHYLMVVAWRKAVAKDGGLFCATATREPREIIALARAFRESVKSSGGQANPDFNFGMHIIVPIKSVGFVFRHRRSRREAIDLLLDSPWREGLWDSWIVGKAMQWLADLEDEGLPDEDEVEHVPKERIVADIRFSHDDAERTTTISCLQPVFGTEGGFLPRHEVIYWL